MHHFECCVFYGIEVGRRIERTISETKRMMVELYSDECVDWWRGNCVNSDRLEGGFSESSDGAW